MLREIRCREAGAPFVVAHLQCRGRAGRRDIWMVPLCAFLTASGNGPERAQAPGKVERELTILSPEEDEGICARPVSGTLFYVGFAFRGWVAYA